MRLVNLRGLGAAKRRGCRDAEGDFVPVPNCTGRRRPKPKPRKPPKKAKKPTPKAEKSSTPWLSDRPFTSDQVSTYNTYTHFPTDINEEFAKSIKNFQEKAKDTLDQYDVKAGAYEKAEVEIDKYRKSLFEFYLTDTKIRLYFPPVSVVGPSKYPYHRQSKFRTRDTNNRERLSKAGDKLLRSINVLVKGLTTKEVLSQWLDMALTTGKLDFAKKYAEAEIAEATFPGSESWASNYRSRGRALHQKLVYDAVKAGTPIEYEAIKTYKDLIPKAQVLNAPAPKTPAQEKVEAEKKAAKKRLPTKDEKAVIKVMGDKVYKSEELLDLLYEELDIPQYKAVSLIVSLGQKGLISKIPGWKLYQAKKPETTRDEIEKKKGKEIRAARDLESSARQEKDLLRILGEEKMHIDDLAWDLYREAGMPLNVVSATLLRLELKNKVHQSAGKMFETTKAPKMAPPPLEAFAFRIDAREEDVIKRIEKGEKFQPDEVGFSYLLQKANKSYPPHMLRDKLIVDKEVRAQREHASYATFKLSAADDKRYGKIVLEMLKKSSGVHHQTIIDILKPNLRQEQVLGLIGRLYLAGKIFEISKDRYKTAPGGYTPMQVRDIQELNPPKYLGYVPTPRESRAGKRLFYMLAKNYTTLDATVLPRKKLDYWQSRSGVQGVKVFAMFAYSAADAREQIRQGDVAAIHEAGGREAIQEYLVRPHRQAKRVPLSRKPLRDYYMFVKKGFRKPKSVGVSEASFYQREMERGRGTLYQVRARTADEARALIKARKTAVKLTPRERITPRRTATEKQAAWERMIQESERQPRAALTPEQLRLFGLRGDISTCAYWVDTEDGDYYCGGYAPTCEAQEPEACKAPPANQYKFCSTTQKVKSDPKGRYKGKLVTRCRTYRSRCMTDSKCIEDKLFPKPEVFKLDEEAVKDIAASMAKEFNLLQKEAGPVLAREIMERGGLKAYRGEVESEEWAEVPLHLKRKTGMTMDEMASEMDFDSEASFRVAIAKAYPKGRKTIRRKTWKDFQQEAEQVLIDEQQVSEYAYEEPVPF